MKDKTKNEWEIEKKILDNPMYNSLAAYFNLKAPGGKLGKVRFTEEGSVVICAMRYGEARLYADIYVEENGAINTMVFDFREIFDLYVAKQAVEKHGADYEQFVFKVLNQANFDPQYVCLFNEYKGGMENDEEKYSTFGICLVGYKDEQFNMFTPWAGVLNRILNALDEVNGFTDSNKKNKLTRKAVDEAAVMFPIQGWVLVILGYLAIIGGIALIIFNKEWLKAVKWIVGILLVLVGIFCGPGVHLSTVSDKKGYYKNSGDLLEKFHRPERKMFITIKD